MKTDKPKLKFKKKVIVIFIEYFLFAAFSQIGYELLSLIFGEEIINYWLFMLFSFFIYYSFPELKFNKSLGMYLFKIELNNSNQQKLNLNFIVYSLASILDRSILLPFHMLMAILNYENVFLCEKLSGIQWKNFEPN